MVSVCVSRPHDHWTEAGAHQEPLQRQTLDAEHKCCIPPCHTTPGPQTMSQVSYPGCGDRTRPDVSTVADGSGARVSQVHIQHSHLAGKFTALRASFCWQALKNANLLFHQHLTAGHSAKGTKSRFDGGAVTVSDWPPDLDQWCQEEDERPEPTMQPGLPSLLSGAPTSPMQSSIQEAQPRIRCIDELNTLDRRPTILLEIFVLNLCCTLILKSHL